MTAQDRILVVDEGEDIALPLRQFFQARGAVVITIAEPEVALQEATTRRPDIILLPATLGEIDGLQFFRRLRRRPRTATIPVMFIIGHSELDRQHELLAAGADDVITRPFDVEIFGLRVRNAIQRARREETKDSITGLPGGRSLAEHLAGLAAQPERCALSVRLVHFAVFRAEYDFITGNEVLRYVAAAIQDVVAQIGVEDAYLGYRPEAEFIAIVPRVQAAPLAAALQARLGDGVRQFYPFAAREQGFLRLADGRSVPLIEVQVTDSVE